MEFPEDAHAIGPRGILASLWGLFCFCLHFINKNEKRKRSNTTRKSTWILIGMIVIMAWLLGSVKQVGAQTYTVK